MTLINTLPVFWDCLPVELWLDIFKYLPQPTLVFIIRKVCRLFKDLSLDPVLWRTVDLNSRQWKDYDPTLMFDKEECVIDDHDSVTVTQLLKELVNQVVEEQCDKSSCSERYNIYSEIYPMQFLLNKNIDELLKYCEKVPSILCCPSIIFVPLLSSIQYNIKRLYLSRSSDFIVSKIMFSHLTKCKLLTHLDLGFCELVDNNLLSKVLPSFNHLDMLGLEGCEKVSDFGLKSISKLPCLQHLNINYCDSVTDLGLQYLCSMKSQLISLSTDGVWGISDRGIILLVQYHSHLEQLHLDGEGLSDSTFVYIFKSLQYLNDFSISFAENISNQSFINLSGCPTSSVSQMQGMKLRKMSGDISTAVLNTSFLSGFTESLRKLTLTDCEWLDDSSVELISKRCPNLEVIGLDWCITITDKGVEFLLDKCSNIRSLSLAGLGRLKGSWISTVEKKIPKINHIDFSMCDTIPDVELLNVIKRIRGMSIVAYYGEWITSENVDEYQLSDRGNIM